MAPIRTHKKSRRGCTNCKTRRVKCNEIHPVCGNCTRRREECEWSSTPSEGPKEQQRVLSVRAPRNLRAITVEESSSSGASAHTEISTFVEEDDLELEMLNLELLHHYTTVTSKTLGPRSVNIQVFQVYAPGLAFANMYLMHSILAFAALHLQTLNPSSDYGNASLDHYRAALAYLSQTPFTGNETEDEKDAYYICNTLLSLYVICARPLPSPTAANDPMNLSWFESVRSILHNMRPLWEHARTGKLAAWSSVNYSQSEIQTMPNYTTFPQSLYMLCIHSSYTPDLIELQDPVIMADYRHAVTILEDMHNLLQYSTYLELIPFIWPSSVTDGFLALLKARKPRALVLLAHFCGILMLMSHRFWWIQRQPYRDFEMITAELGLDEKWAEWLSWPKTVLSQTTVAQYLEMGSEHWWEFV